MSYFLTVGMLSYLINMFLSFRGVWVHVTWGADIHREDRGGGWDGEAALAKEQGPVRREAGAAGP